MTHQGIKEYITRCLSARIGIDTTTLELCLMSATGPTKLEKGRIELAIAALEAEGKLVVLNITHADAEKKFLFLTGTRFSFRGTEIAT